MSSLAWGDYDNDGDLDVAVAGNDGVGKLSTVYRNDSGIFTDADAGLVAVHECCVAWGDYDNDGDLDLALAGQWGVSPNFEKECSVYRSNLNVPNTPPSAPSGLTAAAQTTTTPIAGTLTFSNGSTSVSGSGTLFEGQVAPGDDVRLDPTGAWYRVASVGSNTQLTLSTTYVGAAPPGSGSVRKKVAVFSWNGATDAETPDLGLSYGLRVGTTPGGNQVCSGMSSATGWRRIPARGPVQPGLSTSEWTLTLSAGTYYWSVQAIDSVLAGGAWAPEQTVTVP